MQVRQMRRDIRSLLRPLLVLVFAEHGGLLVMNSELLVRMMQWKSSERWVSRCRIKGMLAVVHSFEFLGESSSYLYYFNIKLEKLYSRRATPNCHVDQH